ncbi:MAG: tetratricopeptide repeat protein [Vicinamibacterales bacterium]
MFPVILAATLGALAIQAPPLPDLALSTYPPAAREMLSRAHRHAAERPDDGAAVGALGRALHAWEQWESAHQAYARAQALAPRAFDWPYLDAIVLQRLARHADAAAQLKLALEIKPDYLPGRIKLAEALLESGDLQQSQPLFEALTKEPLAEPSARVGLGRIAALQDRHDQAIAHFERALALFPELGAAHYGLARAYRANGRAADAARALQQHAKFGPRWPALEDAVLAFVTSLRDDARASLAKGVALADSGDVEAAIAAHEAALSADPTLVHAHANLLTLYGRARNWDKAEEHYRAALAADFETADLHYDYAVLQGLQERWDAAEAAYRRAIAINPLHANGRNNLGQVLERRRDFAAAAGEYRQALEAQPAFRLARFNLGRMLLVLDRLPEAIAEFEKLQQPQDAETPRYVFALATAHVRAGHTAEGRRLAQEAHRLALQYSQAELAAAISRELAKLK